METLIDIQISTNYHVLFINKCIFWYNADFYSYSKSASAIFWCQLVCQNLLGFICHKIVQYVEHYDDTLWLSQILSFTVSLVSVDYKADGTHILFLLWFFIGY